MTTQNRYDTGLNYVVADQPPAPIDQTSLIRRNDVMQAVGGIDKLLNPKAKDEETLALIQHLTPSQRFDKLLENQQVLAEPIVRNGKKATVGYCPDVWGAWE